MLNRIHRVKATFSLWTAGLLCLPVWPVQGATKVWTGVNSTWSNPDGWTPAGVPEAADEIQIDSGSIHLDTPVTIGTRLTWSGGFLHSGSLLVAPGALAELIGEGDKEIQNAVLVNEGTLQIAAGRLTCRFTGWNQFALITNQVTGLVELADTAQVVQVNPGSWTPGALVLANDGVIRKTGAGTSALTLMPLANRGRVEVVAGQLEWTGGGTSPGTFQVLDGCGMDLHTGTFDLGGSRWDGPGPVRIRNSATVKGMFHAENFGITDGNIAGDFEVSGGFEWTGGNLVGAAVRLGVGQHRIAGENVKELIVASFANAGQLLISSTAVGLRFTGYSQRASITNEVGGTVTFAENALLEQRNTGGWPPAQLVFVNAGTLRSIGSTTNRLLDIPLDNSGVVEVKEGRFIHRGGGESNGRWTVSADAVSEWQTGRYRLLEAGLDGPGPTLLNGTITLEGSASAEAFEFQSGILTGSCEIRRGFRWTGGSMASLWLRLGPGNHLIAGDNGQVLQNAALINAGYLVTDAAVVGLLFTGYSQSATLTNESAGTIELRADSRIKQVNTGGWPPALLAWVNQGQIVSSTAGTNWIESIPLHNQGRIDIDQGLLQHTGGGISPGQFLIAGEARMQISGGTYDLGGSQWTGTGPARIVASTRLLGTFEAENFGLAGGDLDGSFDVSGGFEWTGGRLNGATVRLGPGNHRIAGDSGQTLQNSALINAGHLVTDAAVVGLLFTGYSQSATLTNESAGTIELRADSRFRQANSGGWPPALLAWVNQGQIVSSTAGTNWIESIPLHNSGSVEVIEGTLLQTGGGTSPGTFEVGAAGRFEFSTGTYDYDGSRWFGPGPSAIVASATVQGTFVADNFRLEQGDLSGACTIGGGFHWLGGNLVNAQLRLGAGEHRISGPDSKGLLVSSLANAGHLVFEEATVGLLFSGYSQMAVLTNEADGQMDLENGARIEQRNGGGWPPTAIGVFNEGTLRKVDGGVAVLAAVPLVNQGACEVIDGILRVEGNATFESTGKLTVSLGAGPALDVTGTAALAGAIQAATPPGFDVTSGATFAPINAGTISGRFANDIALNPGHIYQYLASYSGNVLTLTSQGGLEEPVQLSNPTLLGGLTAFDIAGRTGLLYLIESSTDLVHWKLDFTTNAPADTLTFVDPRTPLDPVRFYRVGVLP